MFYNYPTNILSKQNFIKNLGLEPLDNEFNSNYLQNKLANRNVAIKNALMNNNILVGVGNIYAAESLFKAKINPQTIASMLTYQQTTSLVKAIKDTLLEAIAAGGTTLKDFVSGDSKPGYFKQKLAVYGRDNLSCKLCGKKIIKIKQAGRSTFFCKYCQK